MTRRTSRFSVEDLKHVQQHLRKFGDIHRLYRSADSPRLQGWVQVMFWSAAIPQGQKISGCP